MRNKFIAALAGLALAVLGSVTPVQAAEGVWSGGKAAVPAGYAVNLETGSVEKAAANALASCASGAICFYDSTTGTGLLEIDYASTHAKSVCYLLASANRNRTSYIVNNYGGYWYVSAAGNCTAPLGTIYPVSRGAMNNTWNNVIDSFYRAT